MPDRMNGRSVRRLLAGAALGAGAAALAVNRMQSVATRNRRRADLRRAGGRRRSIVILGGGFGGVHLALQLLRELPADGAYEVVLVDRSNYFLFTPLLYHAASGLVDPSSIMFPLRELSRYPHLKVREGEVVDIDLDQRTVHLDDGELHYDHLVLALGSHTNYYGQEAKLNGVLPLKTVADSISIRNRMLDTFEAAEIVASPAERRSLLTTVIVGGGATGVELAGALHGLAQGTLARHYPRVPAREARLVICQAAPRLLPGVHDWMARTALEELRGRGVEVQLNARVSRAGAGGVRLAGGESIACRTVIWVAGVSPSPLTAALPAEHDAEGRVVVDPYLQIPGLPGVYAIGDMASTRGPRGGRLPPNAAAAVQQAFALGEIILNRLAGWEAQPFTYVHKGELISLGRLAAIADLGGVRLTGAPAWAVWRGFYLSQLLGVRNRMHVALDWTLAHFYDREAVRLDLADPCTTPLQRLYEPADPPPLDLEALPEGGVRPGRSEKWSG